MRRAFPWVLSIVLLIAFGASFSELQRMRRRFGEVTRHAFHDHADVRRDMIRSAMAQKERPIVIFGDSLAEMAQFPGEICGTSVINAGVGGATLEELAKLADDLKGATFVVVLAGTNDAGSPTFETDYSRLLSKLPSPIAIPGTAFPALNQEIISSSRNTNSAVLNIGFTEFNGVHPTPQAYKIWTSEVTASLAAECVR